VEKVDDRLENRKQALDKLCGGRVGKTKTKRNLGLD
jgi:hypothetical protein